MHGAQTAQPARTTPATYLPGLDGLRALSVVAVLLYHADVPWAPGGFLGVEVFFVISGYLITLLLAREFDRSTTISLTGFWLRRARRLLAAVYLLLAVVSVTALLFYRDAARQLADQVWAALAYVTNWYLIASDESYFAAIERPPVLRHLWSLAIEEQFYLVWPLLLLVLLRAGGGRRGPVALVIVAGAVASLVWMAVLYEPAADPSRVYYGTDTRASGLLFGAALALLWRPNRPWRTADPARSQLNSVALDLAGAGAVAALVACFARLHEFDPFLYRGGFAVVSLATVVCIMAIVHPGSVVSRAVLSHPLLTWIGLRSYSLYLWHWPIFVFTRPELDVPMGIYSALALRLGLTVIAAELSYRYVELPIRNGAFTRWRRRLARRHGARRHTGPIAFAGAAALLLVAVNVTAGGPATPDPFAAAAGPVSTESSPDRVEPSEDAPAGSVPTTVATTTTMAGGPDAVTVLGDSVLLGARPAIEDELGAAGYRVDFRAQPALMIPQSNGQLAAAGAPVGDTVLVGLGYNSLWQRNRANFDEWAEKFDGEAGALLDTLRRLGAKRIVWVTLREPSESVIPPLGREQYRRFVWYFPYVNERLRVLAERETDVILADWAAVSNRAELTYDAMHLTADGVRLMLDTIRRAGGI
jgi:peptidoglycan/LPS O-acetylase OafA/YrhL